jgi:Right handed beta helix region
MKLRNVPVAASINPLLSRHLLPHRQRLTPVFLLWALVFSASMTAEAGSLTLEWDVPSDGKATGYLVFYGKASHDYDGFRDVGNVVKVRFDELVDGSKYCFAVRAYDKLGTLSSFSTEVCGIVSGTPPPPPPPPPPSGKTITVKAGGNVQSALDAAKPGDTILLQAGATFVGNFVLPKKTPAGDAVITIRSSASDSTLPGQGVRITPAYASLLPKLRSPNGSPALATAPGANHYRLQFLEFLSNAKGAGDIVALGDASFAQHTLDSVPYELTLDRVYIHGDVVNGQRRAIALNSAETTVMNSHISGIKARSVDSQAIAGSNGPGPYTISNNYLEAAGQIVLFGGADPFISELVPSDITLQKNHFSKPLAWRSETLVVKNLLELRNAQRVTIDGNLFENSWTVSTLGSAIMLHSVNQGGTAPWSVVQDVEFTNNIVRNVSSAVYVSRDLKSPNIPTRRISIRNNLFDKVSATTFGGTGIIMLVAGGMDISVDHNTMWNDSQVAVMVMSVIQGFTFTNNVLADRGAAIIGPSTAAGKATIAKFLPGALFAGSLFIAANPLLYPVANMFPPTIASVKFVNFTNRDYRLSASSIYLGGATDGTDPGCDFVALYAAQP